jgi:Mn2+/Fe2+ NRAMP family transporter
LALKPLAGAFASYIFAFGLFVASIFSATILPLATSFYVCEAFGFEAGIDKSWREAPEFYKLYTGIILVGAGIILIPHVPLVAITLWTQVVNGLLLPVVLLVMILLVNNPEIMGQHVNKRFGNWVGWITVVVLGSLSLVLIACSIFT